MDATAILGFVLTLVGGGVGTYIATNIAKESEKINIWPGDTAKIRAFVALCSVVVVALSGLVSGHLAPESVQDVMVKIVEFVGVFVVAHGTHAAVKAVS